MSHIHSVVCFCIQKHVGLKYQKHLMPIEQTGSCENGL